MDDPYAGRFFRTDVMARSLAISRGSWWNVGLLDEGAFGSRPGWAPRRPSAHRRLRQRLQRRSSEVERCHRHPVVRINPVPIRCRGVGEEVKNAVTWWLIASPMSSALEHIDKRVCEVLELGVADLARRAPDWIRCGLGQ